MKHHRFIKIAAIAFAVLAAGYYSLLRFVHVSGGYTVAAEYAAMPPDDAALMGWLGAQKGVAAHTIRTARSGQRLRLFFIMSRDLAGHPRFPDLDGACARLGYTGQINHFADYRGDDKDTF